MNTLKFYAIILVVFPIYGIQSKLYKTKNGRTYYIQDKQAFTWNQALLKCSSLDMALASFDNIEKYEDFKALLKTVPAWKGQHWFWLGAIVSDMHVSWITSGQNLIPSLFENRLPSEHCIRTDSESNTVYNYYCNNEFCGFACEDRVSPANCCDRKSNIFLNIKQLN